MLESKTWVALVAGLAVLAESVRTLLVLRVHRGAQVRRHLGLVLLFLGLSILLRAPDLARGVDRAAGVVNLASLLRSVAAMASTLGVLGLLRVIDAVRVRLRHVGAVMGASIVCMAWLTLLPSGREPAVPAVVPVPGYVVISGTFTAGVLLVYVVRMTRIVPTVAVPVRSGICLTLVGFAVSATGVVLALVAVAFPGVPLSAGGWAPLFVQCTGALLLAAGSCYAETVHQVSAWRRRRRCSASRIAVRRLWLYLAPIRRRMSPRSSAEGDTQRQVVDIFDAVILARRAVGPRIPVRAQLAVDAMGLVGGPATRFVHAVELRAAVEQWDPGSAAGDQDRRGVDLAPDVDPVDVDLGAQFLEVAELARLVLDDPAVRRIVQEV